MDREQALRELDGTRRRGVFAGCRGERLAHLTRVSGVGGDGHGVAWHGFESEQADDHVTREIEHHRGLGVEFEWTVYAHDRPADLRERLLARGFAIGPREAVVVLDLKGTHAWIDETPLFRVERARTPAQVRSYQRLCDRAFGRPPRAEPNAIGRELLNAARLGSEQHVAYVAYAGDEPASCGRLHTHPDSAFAGLYGGGTLEEHRSKGLYRSLVAARARDARRLGVRYLRVDALPTSEPILRRLGFVEVTATWPCSLRPTEASPPVR